jgi:GTP pyrophosphokinase
MDQWLQKVKDILVSPNVNDLELLDIIHNDLVSSEITVFTPKGEQKMIQHGATALDLAYQIHTEIGNTAIAAKVNMKLVPLSTVLHQGDTVEIITAENGVPSKDWFRFLQTRHAKNKLMDYFRRDEESIAAAGEKTLEAVFKKAGKELSTKVLTRLVNNLEVKNKEELFFRYGLGLISTDQILQSINRDVISADKPGKIDHNNFVIGSPSDPHKYIIANCCHPISGDPVIGVLSPDGTVTVHKKSCPVAQSFLTKHGEWAVIPRWAVPEDQSFLVRIAVRGIDRVGMLNEITGKISREMGVNIRKIQIGADQGIFDGNIDMMVHDRTVLDKIITIIQGIDGVQTVQRVDI